MVVKVYLPECLMKTCIFLVPILRFMVIKVEWLIFAFTGQACHNESSRDQGLNTIGVENESMVLETW